MNNSTISKQKQITALNQGWKWAFNIVLRKGNPFIRQSCIQSNQALWPVVHCQEGLWATGILLQWDFCGKTMQAVTGKPIKKLLFSRIPRSLSASQRA